MLYNHVMFRLDLSNRFTFHTRMLKSGPFLATIALCLGACATPPPPDKGESSATTSTTQVAMDKAGDGVGNAAAAPLTDLNVRREKIPPLLKTIRNPYAVDEFLPCDEIASQVMALDAILGRDWDIPPPDKASLQERAADGASTAFLDTVASEASGLIPYRGLVRTVSGANKHERKVRKAYERGSHRRTFLKGIGLMKGCVSPAAPIPIEEDEPKVVFK